MAITDERRQAAGAPPEGRTRQRTWLEVLAALTAILLFVTAVLGYVTARATGQSSNLSGTVTDLRAQLEAERAVVDGLRRQNADLAAQLEAGGQTPTTPDTPTPGTANVRHAGQVTIADEVIDLNAPASDAIWGADEGHPVNGPDTASYSWGSVWLSAEYRVMPPGSQVNYAACSTATGYQQGIAQAIKPSELETEACLRLDSGRYAKVKVVDSNKEAVTLDVTTWELV